MNNRMTQGDIIRLLPVNDLLYTRTSPASLIVERTQKKSFAEGGSGAKYAPNGHLIVNLQTGVEFIDPLQSFLVFDIQMTGNPGVLTGSILNVIRDVQVTARSGIELDRLENCNLLNYHMLQMKELTYQVANLNGLISKTQPVNTKAGVKGSMRSDVAGAGLPTASAVRFMIPLRYLDPIFDSDILMPPHIARGLRVDCTLEAVQIAFVGASDATAPTSYEISRPYILCDSYKMAPDTLAFINENYASKDTGLVYEYNSFHTTNTGGITDTSANVEVRRAVSMALDAVVISRKKYAVGDEPKRDSFASYPYEPNDRYQWRIGSHYLPNVPVEGPVEAYAQYLYWCGKLRDEKNSGVRYNDFVGLLDESADKLSLGHGLMCATFQRNNILDQSGIILNNTQTLAVNATYTTGLARNTTVFLRHLRRAVAFLENIVLET
jgi:hypothetical protein